MSSLQLTSGIAAKRIYRPLTIHLYIYLTPGFPPWKLFELSLHKLPISDGLVGAVTVEGIPLKIQSMASMHV